MPLSGKEVRRLVELFRKQEPPNNAKDYLAIGACCYDKAMKSDLKNRYIVIKADENSILTQECKKSHEKD